MKKGKVRQRKEDLARLLAPKLFKAICDPNRIAIMRYLGKHCMSETVSQIAETLPVDVSVVSRHLSILRAIADAFEACCPDQCVMNAETCTEPRLSRPGKGQRRSRTTGG